MRFLRSVGPTACALHRRTSARSERHDDGGEDEREDDPDHASIVVPRAYAVLERG
jgi:hypothetical protein